MFTIQSTKGKGASVGGKTYPVYQHLEGVNRRHVGIAYNRRICNTTQRETPTGSKTLIDGVLSKEHAVLLREEIKSLLEKSAIS